MLFCSPAKEKDQSSLLYSCNWRAKISQLPFASGTVLITMKVFSRGLPSHHTHQFFCRRDEEDNSRCILCCIQQVLCPLKCKRLDRSNQLTCLPVIWVCVSDMGFAQMPCAPESLPPVGRPSLHPCAKSSPLWAWQRTCIFLVTCLQELRKASSVCSVISPNFPRPAA